MRFVRRCFLIVFILSVVVSSPAFSDPAAQHQGRKSPHGGIMQEAEGMHAEFLLHKSGVPKLFLYDKTMKPLERSDLEARLTIRAHGGAEHARALKFSKDAKEGPLFKGDPIKGMTDWDTAVVSLKMKDSWTHMRFSHH